MNIRITHNWLLEYLETETSPLEIQKYLSLCGPSVESTTKINNDWIYEIEITSNRIDTASVLGIAQEAQAILPMFGKKAKLKLNPLEKYRFSRINNKFSSIHRLNIKIMNQNLCSRFAAIVLDKIEIKPSPDFIRQRLTACGIKSINNVIDISNYLMLALGQPTHIFDYDQIKKQVMIMRESKKGERIITLDEKEIILPGGDIVIEDGEGRLIDLCGIMGGLNSAVSDKTQRIVLFVQTYDKQRIRRTAMLTGQRTLAATYFEKGLDEERVESTLVYGVELLEKYAQGKISSPLYDIYPKPYKEKSLVLSYDLLDKTIGVKITHQQIDKILSNLGFKIKHLNNNQQKMLQVIIPSWRADDINIEEDIVEEVARIYGYHNIPPSLPPMVYIKQPKELASFFLIQSKIKYFLKHLGLHEVMNYSMISKEMIESYDFNPKEFLRLSNTISKEIEYMRQSLLPSLVKNIKDNESRREILRFFEIAKIYHPQKDNLPDEKYQLGIAVNTDFFDLKGIIDSLLAEFHIENVEIKNSQHSLFHKNIQGELYIDNLSFGIFGQLNQKYQLRQQLSRPVYLAQLDMEELVRQAKQFSKYRPINPYATIKLDLTIKLTPSLSYQSIKKTATKVSKLLTGIEYVSLYKNNLTLRFYFSSDKRNITEEEAKQELEKIRNTLKV